MAPAPEDLFGAATPARHGRWREGWFRSCVSGKSQTGVSSGEETAGLARDLPVGSSSAFRWRFRTFRGRLAFFFVSLLIVVLATSFFVVLQANRSTALRQIEANLDTG